MNKPIQIVHSDVPITYDEQENKWSFSLRGRDRSAESLAKAKEIIDKPVPAEKAKPFEKIPAWFFRYSEQPKKIDVTGIAEGRGWGREDAFVWINDTGKRSKESVKFNIYPQSEKNDALVAQILAKNEQVRVLKQEMDDLKGNLSPLVLPKED